MTVLLHPASPDGEGQNAAKQEKDIELTPKYVILDK